MSLARGGSRINGVTVVKTGKLVSGKDSFRWFPLAWDVTTAHALMTIADARAAAIPARHWSIPAHACWLLSARV